MRRLLIGSLVCGSLLWPARAAAQATTVVTPSIHVDGAHDTNVLWRPDGRSDDVWRLSPSLSLLRETPLTTWTADAAVDAEWYARHTDLSTPLARRHAAFEGRLRPAPRGRLEFGGSYDSSIRPAELNLTTGLIPGRVRGTRWVGQAEAGYDVTGRTEISTRVQSAGEYTLGLSAYIQDAEGRIDYARTDRHAFHVRYLAQHFSFAAGRVLTHAGVAGWTHRITPALRLALEGGVRRTPDRFRPEIDASASYVRPSTELRLGYAWTQTTALGVLSPVEAQRGLVSFRFARPDVVSGALDGAMYVNDFGDQQSTVYRVSAEIVKPVLGPLSIGAAWSMDHQRGLLVPLIVPVGGLVPDRFRDEQITRHVLLVRAVLAGSIRSMSGPREPAAVRPGREGEPP
jgi:hypothetical protein